MTDELDRLRKELREAEPRVVARAKGMNAAMAAFEKEFASEEDSLSRAKTRDLAPQDKSILTDRDPGSLPGEVTKSENLEKNSQPNQGSDTERRLTGQNAPRGGAKSRRRSMSSRIPTLNMMFGGTAVAAALAAFVVLPNIKGELSTTYDNVGSSLQEVQSETDGLLRADKRDARVIASAEDSASQLSVQAPPPPAPALERQAAKLSPTASAPLGEVAAARPRTSDTLGAPPLSASPSVQPMQPKATFGAQAPADAQPNVYQDEGRDKFETVADNPVKLTSEAPVSTFSIDADTASYSFMRASLNRGQMPNPSSIRVEELINYFPYDYAAPTDAQEPFKSSVTITPTPWNADTKLMHIGIKGYTPPEADRPNANIVLLIDTSGSMNNPNKLPLLINSFKLLLDTLDENDTISIVTYAGSAGTVLEPTAANERAKIVAAFDRLRAGGSTAGAAGLELAYNKAQESFDENGINRVILATDGDFNVGFRSPDEMKTFVEKKRESGVFLSVLGFGQGNYNDHLMQTLAQNGNGVAAYIDTLSEARKVLADESGGALIPIAKDVKIQVEFNPAEISEYRLIGYETRALKREDFNNDKVDAGEIGSGHTVTAIYELTPKGSPAESVDELRYAEAEAAPTTVSDTGDEYAFVKIRYKLPNEDTSTLITRPVGAMDESETLADASTETRFAASVAAFGQMLRGGSRLGEYSYDDLIALANSGRGDDKFGYRAEFIGLTMLAKSLDQDR